MLKNRKIAITTFSSVMLFCVFVVLGFRGLVSSIQSQRDCAWANIDNIEMHGHVDIPEVIKWDCDYEEELNIKRAAFVIDQNVVDIDRYIQTNDLKKQDSGMVINDNQFLNLETNSLHVGDLYARHGDFNGTVSDIILDKSTGQLWVTIKFRN